MAAPASPDFIHLRVIILFLAQEAYAEAVTWPKALADRRFGFINSDEKDFYRP
jgi:hypothetical protein